MASVVEQRFLDEVGGIGGLCAMILYSSPLPVVRQIVRRGSTGEYDIRPYLGLWANTFSWTVYIVHRGVRRQLPNAIQNIFGNMIAVFVLLVFIRFSRRRKRVLGYVVTIVAAYSVAALFTFAWPLECEHSFNRKCWWGGICLATNIAMFISPCLIFTLVWKTKSVEFMPLSVAIGSLVGSTPWVWYGFLLRDPVMIIPNVFGCVVGVSQLALYAFVVSRYSACSNMDDDGGGFTELNAGFLSSGATSTSRGTELAECEGTGDFAALP
mmetsp:Transcript_29432/g.80477  ORF Transcript_29432/g.80477 Transcript_29432/m.80477 type:complete len:268 (-) Transcript_29432:75-878(-)